MSGVPISDFTKTVMKWILQIPEGKVATYKQIAELSGKPQASRGVAWILHSCSTAYKLPWHRVLNSQGKISFDPQTRNFKLQKKRLENEGIVFMSGGQLSLKKYQWSKKPKAVNSTKKPRMFGSR